MQDTCSPVQLKLENAVRRLKLDIEAKDQKLAQQDQAFKRAEQKRIAVAVEVKTTRQKLQATQSRVAQLLQEKENLEDTLEQREVEYQALREYAGYASNKIEKQKRALSRKQEEIAGIRKQLAAVTAELERMKSQLPSFQQELEKITQKLAKKSEEVQMLREAKEEMKLQLEVQKKLIDGYLMQQTAAKSSDANYRKEVEVTGRIDSCVCM